MNKRFTTTKIFLLFEFLFLDSNIENGFDFS